MSWTLISRVSTLLVGIAGALLAALQMRTSINGHFLTSLHPYPQRPDFRSVLILSFAGLTLIHRQIEIIFMYLDMPVDL